MLHFFFFFIWRLPLEWEKLNFMCWAYFVERWSIKCLLSFHKLCQVVLPHCNHWTLLTITSQTHRCSHTHKEIFTPWASVGAIDYFFPELKCNLRIQTCSRQKQNYTAAILCNMNMNTCHVRAQLPRIHRRNNTAVTCLSHVDCWWEF